MLGPEVCKEFDDIVEDLLVPDCDNSDLVSSNLLSAIPDVISSKSLSLYLPTASKAGPVSKRKHLGNIN
jgi:hypothetical protein